MPKGPKKKLPSTWKPTEKEKALALAVDSIEKAFGKGTIEKLQTETLNGLIFKTDHVNQNGDSFAPGAFAEGAFEKKMASEAFETWKAEQQADKQLEKALKFGANYGMDTTKLKGVLEKELLGKKIGDLKYKELNNEIQKLAELVKTSFPTSPKFVITGMQKPKSPKEIEDSKLLINILDEDVKKQVAKEFDEQFKKAYLGVDFAAGVDWSKQYILADPPKSVQGNFESWSSNKLDLNLPTYSELEKLYPSFEGEQYENWLEETKKGLSVTNPCSEILIIDEVHDVDQEALDKVKHSIAPDVFTKDQFHKLRQQVQMWWRPKNSTQLALKRFLTRVLPVCCPIPTTHDVGTHEAFDAFLEAVYRHHFKDELNPNARDVYEITLSGLTEQEAKEVLSKYSKSKSGKPVFQSTKQLKEIGTNSKAIISWTFPSSSMAVNGEPRLYKTQLNEDGTLSCQCNGWCVEKKYPDGSAKPRKCKHTTAIEEQFDVGSLYKKWKKGEPLGDDFVQVTSNVAAQKVGETSTPVFAAKRIVEI